MRANLIAPHLLRLSGRWWRFGVQVPCVTVAIAVPVLVQLHLLAGQRPQEAGRDDQEDAEQLRPLTYQLWQCQGDDVRMSQ